MPQEQTTRRMCGSFVMRGSCTISWTKCVGDSPAGHVVTATILLYTMPAVGTLLSVDSAHEEAEPGE